ncbi:hypothetical protein KBY88_09970 [Cyanobium sp. Morenito 9A2]|nr:hypothetical protein [Cyanobium sp. Morenito 9A2]
MAVAAPFGMPADPQRAPEADPSRERRIIAERLSDALGEPVEVVSHAAPGPDRVSGLAVCSGRLLSYVIDAQARTLRTRNLLELTRRSRQAV